MSRYLGLANDFRKLLRWLIQQRDGNDERDEREGSMVVEARRHCLFSRNKKVGNGERVVAIVSRREVNLIIKALLTSWSRLIMNVEFFDFRELSFQLVGRLIDPSEEMKGVKRYLDSVRKWTRTPYVLPGKGCSESVRECVEEVYVGGGRWRCTALNCFLIRTKLL